MIVTRALRWIPNAICLVRIALVPIVIGAIAHDRFVLGVSLFFVAGFSDGIDGFLARRYNWRTALGAILDPIADKLLLIGTFLVLAWSGLTPVWLAIVVIGRDVFIMGGAITYHFLYGDLEGKPSRISKFYTLALLVYVVAVLLLNTGIVTLPATISAVLLAGLVALLLASLVISTYGYVTEWRTRSQEHHL